MLNCGEIIYIRFDARLSSASKTNFTITETSDILGVSVSTVYRLLKSRKLYAERLSEKETLVSLKSIESYKAYLKSDEILAQHNAYTIHDLIFTGGDNRKESRLIQYSKPIILPDGKRRKSESLKMDIYTDPKNKIESQYNEKMLPSKLVSEIKKLD